jgi:hypothetical protein
MSISSLLVTSLVLLAPAAASPVNVDIQERQIIEPGVISYLGLILKGALFNGNTLACDGDFQTGQEYYFGESRVSHLLAIMRLREPHKTLPLSLSLTMINIY